MSKFSKYERYIRYIGLCGCLLFMQILFTGNLYAQDAGLRLESSSGTVYLNIGANAKLNISAPGNTGGIRLEAGGSIDNSGSMNLSAGTWINNGNGLINGSAGTVKLDNSNPQPVQGSVPTVFYDLVVDNPAGVSMSKDVVVNHNLVLTNGSLAIGAHTLTVNGAVTGPGTISGSAVSDLIIGGSAGTLNFTAGSRILKNLTLNSGASATLGTALDIVAGTNPGVVTVNSGATLNSAGNLILKSDINGTAMVGNSAGTITGNVTAERFIGAATPKAAWRLLTAPLRSGGGANGSIYNYWQNAGVYSPGIGTQVTGPGGASAITGIDQYTVRPSVQYFDHTVDQNLHPVTDTKSAGSATPLFTTAATAANKSYFIFTRGDRAVNPGDPSNNTVLKPVGNLLMGNQTFATATANAGDNTIVGNPYAAPVDLAQFRADNLGSNTKTTYYYWDPYMTGAYGYGAYVTVSYDAFGNETITPAGASHTRFLQSGQAMFLERNISGTGTASVTFKESQKGSSNAPVFLTAGQRPDSLAVNLHLLQNNEAVMLDGALTAFDKDYAAVVDDYDAGKFPNTGESISFKRNGISLAIERRQPIAQRDTLFLNISSLKAGNNYRLEFAAGFTNPGFMAFLQDSYVPGSNYPLSVTSASHFDFNVTSNTATAAANRFRIVFTSLGSLPVTFTSIQAAKRDKQAVVEWKVANQLNIEKYEVERSADGQRFSPLHTRAAQGGNGSDAVYTWTDASPLAGTNYYRIRAVEFSGIAKYSSIAQVAFDRSQPAILVYPNPLPGRVFKLDMQELAKGTYQLNLFNSGGQLVYSQSWQHDGSNSTRIISLEKDIPAGVYQLQISGDNGFKRSRQLVRH